MTLWTRSRYEVAITILVIAAPVLAQSPGREFLRNPVYRIEKAPAPASGQSATLPLTCVAAPLEESSPEAAVAPVAPLATATASVWEPTR